MSIFKAKNKSSLKKEIKALIPALLLALLFRSIFYEPYKIPSDSMNPNLVRGDYILVSKYIYGISYHSFPFSPKFFSDRKFVFKKPERGEIIVFRLPENESIKYIKRLIGLPGDKIQLISGELYINGKVVKRHFIKREEYNNRKIYNKFEEILDNKNSYEIIKAINNSLVDDTDIYEVPKGHYFFLGDNRNHSKDSRFIEEVGYIPEENIMGEAQIILFSSDSPFYKIWDWIKKFNYSRIFKRIRPILNEN